MNPAENPHRLQHLCDLAARLAERSPNADDVNDLDTAIELMTEAIETTPPNSPELARRIDQHGELYAFRYGRTENLEDLTNAIESLTEAINIAGTRSPNRSARLSMLAQRYQTLYAHTKISGHLETATRLSAEAETALG